MAEVYIEPDWGNPAQVLLVVEANGRRFELGLGMANDPVMGLIAQDLWDALQDEHADECAPKEEYDELCKQAEELAGADEEASDMREALTLLTQHVTDVISELDGITSTPVVAGSVGAKVMDVLTAVTTTLRSANKEAGEWLGDDAVTTK